MRKSPAVENPWLTMYSVEPAPPTLVIAKMPRTMKPKWLIEVNAMRRIMSVCPMASSAP